MDTMDLFSAAASSSSRRYEPLAQRMRPRNFREFIGQQEAVGEGRYLRKMIEKDELPSLIFYGPPGTGKTTLALHVIAEAQRLQSQSGWKVQAIEAVPTSTLPTPARRPHNSRLATQRFQSTFNLRLPPWQQGVERMLAEIL